MMYWSETMNPPTPKTWPLSGIVLSCNLLPCAAGPEYSRRVCLFNLIYFFIPFLLLSVSETTMNDTMSPHLPYVCSKVTFKCLYLWGNGGKYLMWNNLLFWYERFCKPIINHCLQRKLANTDGFHMSLNMKIFLWKVIYISNNPFELLINLFPWAVSIPFNDSIHRFPFFF